MIVAGSTRVGGIHHTRLASRQDQCSPGHCRCQEELTRERLGGRKSDKTPRVPEVPRRPRVGSFRPYRRRLVVLPKGGHQAGHWILEYGRVRRSMQQGHVASDKQSHRVGASLRLLSAPSIILSAFLMEEYIPTSRGDPSIASWKVDMCGLWYAHQMRSRCWAIRWRG